MRALGEEVSMEDAQYMIAEADVDGDKEIDFEGMEWHDNQFNFIMYFFCQLKDILTNKDLREDTKYEYSDICSWLSHIHR